MAPHSTVALPAFDENAMYALFRSQRHATRRRIVPLLTASDADEIHMTSWQLSMHRALSALPHFEDRVRAMDSVNRAHSCMDPRQLTIVVEERANDTYFEHFMPEFYHLNRPVRSAAGVGAEPSWSELLKLDISFKAFNASWVAENAHRRVALADVVAGFLTQRIDPDVEIVNYEMADERGRAIPHSTTLGEARTVIRERIDTLFADKVSKPAEELAVELAELRAKIVEVGRFGRVDGKRSDAKKLRQIIDDYTFHSPGFVTEPVRTRDVGTPEAQAQPAKTKADEISTRNARLASLRARLEAFTANPPTTEVGIDERRAIREETLALTNEKTADEANLREVRRKLNELKMDEPFIEFDLEDRDAFNTLSAFAERFNSVISKLEASVTVSRDRGPTHSASATANTWADRAKRVKVEYDATLLASSKILILRRTLDAIEKEATGRTATLVWNFHLALQAFFRAIPKEMTPCCEHPVEKKKEEEVVQPPPPPPPEPEPEPELEPEPEPEESEGEEVSSEGSQEILEEEEPEPPRPKTKTRSRTFSTAEGRKYAASTTGAAFYSLPGDNAVRFAPLYYATKVSSGVPTGIVATRAPPQVDFIVDERGVAQDIEVLLAFNEKTSVPDFIQSYFISELQKYADESPLGRISAHTEVKSYLVAEQKCQRMEVHELNFEEEWHVPVHIPTQGISREEFRSKAGAFVKGEWTRMRKRLNEERQRFAMRADEDADNVAKATAAASADADDEVKRAVESVKKRRRIPGESGSSSDRA